MAIIVVGGASATNAVNSPAQLTAGQDDYALPSADIVRLDADAAVNITGFVAASAGKAVLLVNVGANAITIKHEDAGSVAANRVIVPGAVDYEMAADGGTAVILYDGTSARWRVI